MAKASAFIKAALKEIVVLGAEAPLEASEAQDAIFYLNNMMAAFDADGIPLGYTEVSDLGDTVTIPAGANDGTITQLAVRLWDQFADGQPVPSTLLARAISGKDTMRNIAFTIGASEFPSTLPIGSGNEWESSRIDKFYPDLQDEILAETTGSIGIEESTT